MTYTIKIFAAVLISLMLVAAARAEPPKILVMGDSFMTSNTMIGRGVPNHLRKAFGKGVKSRAMTGARYVHRLPVTGALGMKIARQYRPDNWDVVVMNGGGNDLMLGCGCMRCKKRLNRLISPDGRSGEIPAAVARARRNGAQVIYVGYLRSPGSGSPIERCRKVGDALEARLNVMAKHDSGTRFVSLADMVPYGDRSYHALDMIHPSVKGSEAASERIINAVRLSLVPGAGS